MDYIDVDNIDGLIQVALYWQFLREKPATKWASFLTEGGTGMVMTRLRKQWRLEHKINISIISDVPLQIYVKYRNTPSLRLQSRATITSED